jgi:hypothetical protein
MSLRILKTLRVGQPVTPEQFDELTNEQLGQLVTKAYREFFPARTSAQMAISISTTEPPGASTGVIFSMSSICHSVAIPGQRSQQVMADPSIEMASPARPGPCPMSPIGFR